MQTKSGRFFLDPDRIEAEELKRRMDTAWPGRAIFYEEEMDSTNTRARILAKQGSPHGTLVAAGCQRLGRGRVDHSWYSPKGGIYLSLILRPEFPAKKASMLTLLAALAAVKAIEEETGLCLGIKWPNDLVLCGKKVAGILTEMTAVENRIDHIVVGFGINANIVGFPEELRPKATSLEIETGGKVCLNKLSAAVVKDFEEYYHVFKETLGMGKLMAKYNDLLINKGKTVRISKADKPYEAYAYGINDQGELLVRKGDRTIEKIYAGEVFVLGKEGIL